MAGTTGLEPATSYVTGRRSNQLSYVPAITSNVPILPFQADVALVEFSGGAAPGASEPFAAQEFGQLHRFSGLLSHG